MDPWHSRPKLPTAPAAPIGSKNGSCSARHAHGCGALSRTPKSLAIWCCGPTTSGAPIVEGRPVRGNLTFKGYEHVVVEMLIERIDPERYFSYRWHPGAVDPAVDYSAEPTTLVEFTLEDADGGTAVTIVESGFDRIPLARRAEAFRMNNAGWDGQIKNLAQYVA